jgi:hypothetical protein
MRVWVLQELVLSRDSWIQCGMSLVRWDDFVTHIDEKNESLRTEETKVLLHMENLYSEQIIKIQRVSLDIPRLRDRTLARKLLDILDSRRGFGVADPRDILFAHVGLIGNLSAKDDYSNIAYSQLRLSYESRWLASYEQRSSLIEVDYKKEDAEVYCNIARLTIDLIGVYSVFSHIGYRGSCIKHLPS